MRGSLREALRLGGAAGLLGFGLVLLLAWADRGTPFAPGEYDLLPAARAMAGGRLLPIWVGAVHPDAVGTYLAAAALAPLLWLGVPGTAALKLLGAAHFGLLCGAGVGLAARLGGRDAAMGTAALLLLGAPALVAAHTQFLGTTVEVAGIEAALLWAALEWRDRPGGPRRAALALPGGLLLGLAVAYSLHAAWLALFVAGLALTSGSVRDRALGLLGWALPAAAVFLPWIRLRDPLGPPQTPLSIKSMHPLELVSMLDGGDLLRFASRLPFALLPETVHIPPESALRWLAVPWALALAIGLILALLRPPVPGARAVALYGLGVAAPVVLAGDLLGYPAGYRYFLPAVAPAAIALALTAADRLRGARRAVRVLPFALLAATALPTLPRASVLQLETEAAAYFAAQHRLAYPRRSVHHHFLLLTPYVADAELKGWLEGYGLHCAREYNARLPVLRIEHRDAMTEPGHRVPPSVDRTALALLPETWWEPALLFEGEERAAFFRGLGLGLAEDGRLGDADRALLASLRRAGRLDAWVGVGGALGERLYWSRGADPDPPLRPGPVDPEERAAFASGFAATAGPYGPGPGPEPTRPIRFAMEHPFTYAEVGLRGRGAAPDGD